jgi:adenylate cyclase class IV
MKIKKVNINLLECWEKNPRAVKERDFERLKRQIRRFGFYKPLIVTEEQGKYIVLGGNVRLLALKELGFHEVEVSIVDAPTEKEKIEYSLSDNDRVGFYQDQQLAELVYPFKDEIQIEDFKVDIEEPISLSAILEEFGPSKSSESRKLITIICEDEEELFEIQKLLGMEGKKSIKAKEFKQILNNREP